MSLYLIQPALEPTPEFSPLEQDATPRRNGARQWRPTVRPRLIPPPETEIWSWLEELQQRKGTAVLKLSREISSFTGTVHAELTPDDVELLRARFPGIAVARDRALNVIRAESVPDSHKEQLDPGDLWHFDQVGLARGATLPTGERVRVAVLDSGIDPSHPEVRGKTVQAAIVDRETGTVRVVPVNSLRDLHGHGTKMASLICGESLGIAPGAELVNVVISRNGAPNRTDLNLALGWVGNQPEIRIINLSVGLPGTTFDDSAVHVLSKLMDRGVLPIIAVGNGGPGNSSSPGNYAEPLSVGATDRHGRVAFLSGGGLINSRYTVPDLVAPGDGVFVARPEGGYEAVAGTSASAAIVSGIAALILAGFPEITMADWIDKLVRHCKNLTPDGAPPIRVERQGSGLVQVPPFP